ncbi:MULTISPECIES: histidine phosphatase family protein [Serratia]|jgi:broad specificity phosphatase PhoE|uniref:histidine phosphatase family protein n=1 Tax=Serratia TaxID=613 RepID=UPI000D507C16|nr:histidine phosphatase family protein [Serratia liquefaciens]MDU4173946.1 histidine phosphatase family protein [Serratia liquefaciens]PVD40692.1 histidine phosphatase family protein [Serratia liquefaciens]QHT49007.1 histidine phosphatase family protein [Serratia liquefaciens]QIC84947.1 histidine phosphatase family protein [Serratia liquefaciens]RYM70445.1 histidine phosphatase family protein [Serratia liquefaciens]
MFNKIGNKILGGLAALLLSQSVLAQETLIFVRHGEKPANDSGQLTCKGLNRALALPDVLLDRYGKPDFIFAAGPKENKTGSSLRALSTIMPTAVRVGLPIGIQFHADDIAGLQQELLSDKYQNSRIFIAWEHKNLDKAVKNIVAARGGDASLVPEWPGSDFDSIFVVTLDQGKVSFRQEREGLTQLAESCPFAG